MRYAIYVNYAILNSLVCKVIIVGVVIFVWLHIFRFEFVKSLIFHFKKSNIIFQKDL